MSEIPDDEVTQERAEMLAAHAYYVQGGYSTPEIEAERARQDLARGGSINWTRMAGEVAAAVVKRLEAE